MNIAKQRQARAKFEARVRASEYLTPRDAAEVRVWLGPHVGFYARDEVRQLVDDLFPHVAPDDRDEICRAFHDDPPASAEERCVMLRPWLERPRETLDQVFARVVRQVFGAPWNPPVDF